jgi:hypothetical protein
MTRKRYLAAGIAIGLVGGMVLAVLTTAHSVSSITLDQPNPVYGQTVTFTGVYPKEASRKVGRQQQWNPAVQVDCSQNGVHVFTANNVYVQDTHLPSGELTGVSGPIQLGVLSNGNTWIGGAASCDAALYYFGHDQLIHVLAEIQFEVGA